MKFLVTGGAGFIGSALVRCLLKTEKASVLNIDKLTYAGSLASLDGLDKHPNHFFVHMDINETEKVTQLLLTHRPQTVFHLAAESHVDRSIDGPASFIHTNMVGTFSILEAVRNYWEGLKGEAKTAFRFLHISTDEVFGSLGPNGFFREDTPYEPNSPYSASKAGSDHLVRAWHHTYGLPTITTNCTNNYGPFQFPEKLIPLVIQKARTGQPIPVYGKGDNVRDWLFVEDHVQALLTVQKNGRPGETYNIGGCCERTNLEVVKTLCQVLDRKVPGQRHEDLIRFVQDRPGHDKRYAMDITKIRTELGWSPQTTLDAGIEKTVDWYLTHQDWYQTVIEEKYAGHRLGVRPSEPTA